jgi:hypothetical protein
LLCVFLAQSSTVVAAEVALLFYAEVSELGVKLHIQYPQLYVQSKSKPRELSYPPNAHVCLATWCRAVLSIV